MLKKLNAAVLAEMQIVNIGLPHGYTLHYLQSLISKTANFKNLKLNVIENNVENLINQLLENKLQLLLIPAIFKHPDLIYENLKMEEFYLAVPQKHLANTLIQNNLVNNTIDLKFLEKYPFISLYSRAYTEFVNPLFDEAGFKPQIIFKCDNWNNSHALVEQGLGLSIVPYWFAEKKEQTVNYYHIQSQLNTKRTFAIVYNQKYPLSLDMQKLISHLKQTFGDDNAFAPFDQKVLTERI